MDTQPLIRVNNLSTFFYTDRGVVPAVNDVSFAIHKGETLGLVGESGCGKSVTALSILRLIPSPPGRIVSGRIYLEDREITAMSMSAVRRIRGNEISMIFQAVSYTHLTLPTN